MSYVYIAIISSTTKSNSRPSNILFLGFSKSKFDCINYMRKPIDTAR